MQMSFYSRVGSSFLIIILILLVLMGIGMFAVVSSTMNDTILEKNRDLTNSLSYRLQLILNNTEDSLRNTARLIEMDRLEYDVLQAYLETIEAEMSMIDMIQIVGSDGRVRQVIPYDDSLVGIDLSGHSFLKEAEESGQFSWSQSFLSPESGEPTITVCAAFNDFSIVYYLDLGFLGRVLFSERDKEQGILYILDKDGTYIAHPDNLLVARRENLRHNPIIRRLIDHKGPAAVSEITRDEILTLNRIDPTGWVLVYEQSVRDAFSLIRFYRNIMMLGSFLTFILVALILYFLIKDTVIPLRSLVDAAGQVSSGSYRMSICRSSVREINELAEHFNIMVTSVREREEDLLRLRNYLSSIINSMPSVIICVDKNRDVVLWNHMAEEFSGYNDSDAEGKSLEKVYPQLASSLDIIDECLRLKKASVQKACSRVSPKRGAVFEDITVYPLVTEEREGAVIRIDDVTERVNMQNVVLQTEKLGSLGGLAAGMAHDFNNLLTPIMGYSEMMMRVYESDQDILGFCSQIYEAGERAQHLIHKLLVFSRKQTLEHKFVNLNEVVRGFEKLLRRTIREDITIDFELSPEDGMIMADMGQIEQVLMNLCVNAQDAMGEGGTLKVGTGRVRIEGEDGARLDAEPGIYNELFVSDTGTGMDEATLKHIYEPFYSTKGEYGNGLGLATVYGIVKQHKGFIRVESEVGKGSSFHVYLKSEEKEKNKEELISGNKRENQRGDETILVAEDNRQVRKIAETLLVQKGYTVLTAENGKEALEILRTYKEKIDLLLTDLIMPEMNGRELFNNAQKILKNLKVVYMSGHTDDIISSRNDLEPGVYFLQKPFTLTSLSEKIREALDFNNADHRAG